LSGDGDDGFADFHDLNRPELFFANSLEASTV